MTRKPVRVDEHPGALGFIVGHLRTRKFSRKNKQGKRETKRLAFSQVYRIVGRDKMGRNLLKPAYGFIYGIQDPVSEFFLDKNGVRFTEVETIPKEEIDRTKKALKWVLKGPISVMPE